jgi:hypothetical protein
MERSRGRWLIWAAAGLGLLLRGYHYARGPAVWHDEAALLVNVIHLPVADSLGPLLHDEASPPLFLLLEKAVAAVLGDGKYSLRLPSFLAACGAVLFTASAARRLLPPVWAAIAVGLVAVSDRLLFHACEAKWYSLDVGVAAGAIWAVVATKRWPLWKFQERPGLPRLSESGSAGVNPAAPENHWSRSNVALVGILAAPVCIWLSFPACFVFGGVLVALLPSAWKSDWRGKAAFVAFALSVMVSFGLLAVGPAQAQRTGPMNACWNGCFAPWAEPPTNAVISPDGVGVSSGSWLTTGPLRVPVWAISNTFDVVRYSAHPYGWPLLVPALVGAWSWLRKPGGWETVCVCLLPMGLALVAACLSKYPYAAARTMAFVAPGLVLLVGEGLRRFWDWCEPPVMRGAFLLLWVPVLLIPAGYTARRVVEPWPRAESDQAAECVLSHRADGEPITANHWEYEYHFRRVNPELLRVEHNPEKPKVKWKDWIVRWETEPDRPRIWYVHQSEVGLPKVPTDPLPVGYQLGESVTFGSVRVWVLVPER